VLKVPEEEEVKAGQRSTREEVLMMILTFAMSVLYISLLSVSVSIPVCIQSMNLVMERIDKRNIYSQLPTIGGTGLFRVAY
jgi:hypothetical protein